MEIKNKNSLKIPLLLLIGVVLFSFGVNAASAANISTDNSTIYVNNTQGNDAWDGQSATIYNSTCGPKQTISNATGTVADNGTIYIAGGTYYECNITINTNMTIIGENQESTIIDAQGMGNIFVITPGEGISFTLVNLTLQNGNSTNGGAIDNEGLDGILNIANVTFNNNTATNVGGAIYSTGTLTENQRHIQQQHSNKWWWSYLQLWYFN